MPDIKAVMRGVIQASKQPLTMTELFARTMRIMGQNGNVNDLVRACGYEPDDLVYPGENFTSAFRLQVNRIQEE